MAVLWEQRKMVSVLDQLTKEKLAKDTLDATTGQSNLSLLFSYSGDENQWIEENKLIRKIIKEEGKDESDVEVISKLRSTLNACILPDKFIDDMENPDFSPFSFKNLEAVESSKRLVKVNNDKGTELLNNTYFWLKYIPEKFPEPAKIAVSVLVTIITAIITSGVFLSFFKN